jgi:predicted nucleic acid-binding protein
LATGLDTNILCYALDPAFPENPKSRKILLEASPDNRVGINTTVLHETYHTLVFYQKWIPSEARQRLLTLLQHPHLEFYSQTRRISQIALDIAARNKLGGRDSLIIANFLANQVPLLYTNDDDLLELGKLEWKKSVIRLDNPLK